MKRIPLSLQTAFLAILAASAPAGDISKLQNASALNTGGSWNGGTPPGPGDVMLWDSLFTTPTVVGSLSPLGGDMSVSGIKVTNVGGTANQANLAYVGFGNASSANTLTIGAGGVDLSAATQALRLQSKIQLGASQNWAIGNANTAGNPMAFNNGEDVGFEALAAGTAFNLGGNTVTTSGAGQLTITSGFTLSNGTVNVGNNLFLVQGGGSRVTTINNNVTFNVATGSTLHIQSNSGAINSAASVNLNGGTLKLVSNNATQLVTLTGGTTTVNSASTLSTGNNYGGGSVLGTAINYNASLAGSAPLSLISNASTATPLVMGGNNSGYSGTISISGTAGRIIRIGTATAGSAAATWSVGAGMVLQTNGTAVDLGTLTGTGIVNNNTGAGTVNVGAGTFGGTLVDGTGTLGLNKTGPGTLTLTGANTYSGPTSVSAGTLLATPAQTAATAVTVADGAAFGVNLTTSGAALNVASLTTGTTTGAAVQFNLGTLGNTTTAPLNTAVFTPTAQTTLRIAGSNFTPNIPFPLLHYSGGISGLGFAGLSLGLPFRVTGNLVDNAVNSTVDAVITGSSLPAWRGTVNGNWDVDSVGNGSTGTANWFASTGPNTYVQGAPAGTDSVLFDDTVGAGPTMVNLTTTLTPVSLAVNNSLVNYTFTGAGKISGATGIVKDGTGSLTLTNTGGNDYTGPTQINAGTLRVGDGATNGAGSLGSAAVTNNSILIANRPDGLTIAGALNSTGDIIASKPLTLNAASTISGVVSGSGALTTTAGNLLLSGGTANTNTGLTTVSSGDLQLNKPAGVDAVGGDIRITGTGRLVLQAGEQIPDTATINFTGSSTDSIPTQAGLETVGNVIVNSSTGGAGGGQVIMRNNFTVSGTGSVQSGILGVGSGQTGTVNAINITCPPGSNGIVRIAGNSSGSTLNVGAGGITASGGEIQVKFNTNAQDAVLNLGGNFTTTGNVIVTNAGFTGANLNVINLTGTRTFNIGGGTVTTVDPDLSGIGGLVKDGGGQLALTALCAGTYTGDTVLNLGILRVDGTLTGTNVISNGGGLSGIGTITTGLLGVVLNNGGSISPATVGTAGTLTIVATGSELNVIGAVTPAHGSLSYCDLDTPATSDRILLADGTLNIGSGLLGIDDISINPLAGFGPGTYTLIETTAPIAGTLASNVTASVSGFTVTMAKGDNDTDLILNVTSGQTGLQTWRQTYFGTPDNTGNASNNADPDNDSLQNLVEFLFGTIPNSAASAQSLTAGEEGPNLTLTYSRAKAALTDVDAIPEASPDLTTWSTAGISEAILSDNGTTQVVKVSIAKSAARRFLRIRVQEK